MCNNPFKYDTQYRKKIGEYLFPKGSTYILGQKYWGSTFKLENKYWGSTFSRGVFLGCYTGTQREALGSDRVRGKILPYRAIF